MNHACGQCAKTFKTENEYLGHICPKQPKTDAPKLSESDILAAVMASRRKNSRV